MHSMSVHLTEADLSEEEKALPLEKQENLLMRKGDIALIKYSLIKGAISPDDAKKALDLLKAYTS
jgi:hypothetical protein